MCGPGKKMELGLASLYSFDILLTLDKNLKHHWLKHSYLIHVDKVKTKLSSNNHPKISEISLP